MKESTRLVLALFNRSVLKQQKWKMLSSFLGPTQGLRCLDIGADNGVISHLLRQEGGQWSSADLDPMTVRAIRDVVGSDVHQIDGGRTPFSEDTFDRVVIVDFLEHIEADEAFLKELHRVMRGAGELIINVPHLKNSWLRRFRLRIGQTDEKHGHVRPGYTLERLRELLGPRFEILQAQTYSKFFTQTVDTLITWVYGWIKGGQTASRKGTVVTGDDLQRYKKQFRFYSVIYPFVWLISQLDGLFIRSEGYMLIVKAKLTKRPAAKAYKRVPAVKASNGRSSGSQVIAKGAR